MNKALKGNKQEIIYTKLLNKKDKFWSNLDYEKDISYAIHVNTKKYGKINEAKIQPKADIFFAKGHVDNSYLIDSDYYLSENDLEKFKLKPIAKSGISVKLSNSRYTITKISPNTFFKIFDSNILGAGASIYCNRENEFIKNKSVLEGWSVKEDAFYSYFINVFPDDEINLHNKNVLKKIKHYSNIEISNMIVSSQEISDLLFKGIGNFEEPFTAHWLIENDVLKENYYIPFKITTGSGRSKGIYTIVMKPK